MDEFYIDCDLLLPGSKKEYAFAACFFDFKFPKSDKERNRWAFAYDYVHGIYHKEYECEAFMNRMRPCADRMRFCKYEFYDDFIKFICNILRETDLIGFVHGNYGFSGRSLIMSHVPITDVYAHCHEELIISGLNTDKLYTFYQRSVRDPVFVDPVEEFFYYTLIWTYTHDFDDQAFSIDLRKLYEVENAVGFFDDMYPCLTYDFDFEYAREEYRNGNKDIFKKFRPMTKEERKGTKYENWEEED